jgi:hypothetical protein
MGLDMVQAVWALVASAEGPLLERYAAVQEEYSACTTCLDKVLELLSKRSELPALAPASHTPPAIPGGDATVPSCPPSLDHGGDTSYRATSADADSPPVDAHGGVQRHLSFPKGGIEDFNFSHPPERESACSDGSPPCGASACFPSRDGQVCFPPSDIDTNGDMVPGGKITTPCLSNRSRVACAKNTSKFDLVGLAEENYHIKEFGVKDLTPQIINKCRYQSFHWDHPEGILQCYSKIAKIHRIVLQGWVDSRTHFCGLVVEYIIEKALPVFPRLGSLEVADVVKFYDSVQKISM